MIRLLTLSMALAVIASVNLFAQPPGYTYGKQILIQASQVSGTGSHTNFPVLISFTDPNLKSAANGGHVQNANGYDIMFTMADCNTQLDHEIEKFDPTTGELLAWVKIPSLSTTANTNIHMYYGNGSVVVNPSTSATWSSYHGVWHLDNSFLDQTSNGYNGTNNGSGNIPTAVFDAGRSFNVPNNWIQCSSFPNMNSNFSISGWAYTTNNSRAGQRIFCDDRNNSNGGYAMSIGDPGAGRIRFYIRGLGPVSLDSPGGTISNNTWHYCVAVADITNSMKYLYVDGNLVASGGFFGALGSDPGAASIGGEVPGGEVNNRFSGNLDEIRVANVSLSSGWVATEYNNQTSPSSFYTTSAEMSASNLCTILPIELLDFKAEYIDKSTGVKLTWTTASEINNDYFTVERSQDGKSWQAIKELNAAGQSRIVRNYQTYDPHPFTGINYYRLKQTDFNGSSSYSDIVNVDVSKFITRAYPAVFSDGLILEGVNTELSSINIFNSIGQDVTALTKSVYISKHKIKIDCSNLSSGVYIIRSKSFVQKVIKR